MATKQQSVYVYHEIQVSGLCGVHCLNTLFQNPIFNEVILSNIAHSLDEKERQLMFEHGGATKEFLQYMSEESGNVGDSGNFSVQVLQKALSDYGLDCTLLTPSNYPTVFSTFYKHSAFICNRGEHWYTIRKIDNEWYDLNSLLQAPRKIPELILADELQRLVREVHSIYLINGKLPDIPLDRKCSSDGKWIRVKGTDEDDFAIALELSKKESENENEKRKSRSNSYSNNIQPENFFQRGNSISSGNNEYSGSNSGSKSLYPEMSYPSSHSNDRQYDYKQKSVSYPSTSTNTTQSYNNSNNQTSSSSSSLSSSADNNPLKYQAQKILNEPTQINTQDFSYEQIMMHQYFGKCLSTMERLNERLIKIENTIRTIQSNTRN